MVARRTCSQNVFYFSNLSNINLPRDGGSDEGGTVFGEAGDGEFDALFQQIGLA